MKLLFFLFIVITILCLCNNSLIEGNNHNIYDTDNDRTHEYDTESAVEMGYISSTLDSLGISFIIDWIMGNNCLSNEQCVPDDDGNLIGGCSAENVCDNAGDNTWIEQNCSEYNSETNKNIPCPILIGMREEECDFAYSEGSWAHDPKPNIPSDLDGAVDDRKKMCATCTKCRDGGLFPDVFYGWYCDALNACGTFPDTSVAYNYAYNSVDWDSECPENVTGRRKIVCSIAQNTVTEMIAMLKRGDSMVCAADIVTNEAEDILC